MTGSVSKLLITTKHLAGHHDQRAHGKKGEVSTPGAFAKPISSINLQSFSRERVPVPREKQRPLVNQVLAQLGAPNLPTSIIYSDNDPAYARLFRPITNKGLPLPEFVPGQGPILDFGDGDKTVSYSVYDTDDHKICVFEDMFIYGELDAASCLAHEVNHALLDEAKRKNKNKYDAILKGKSGMSRALAASDGVTNYSRHYWQMVAKGKQQGKKISHSFGDIDEEMAISETLAEMAKLRVKDRARYNNTVHPVWRKLYDDVVRDGGSK